MGEIKDEGWLQKTFRTRSDPKSCDFKSPPLDVNAPSSEILENTLSKTSILNLDYKYFKDNKCVPTNLGENQRLAAVAMTAYAFETNDYHQQKALEAIMSIDSMLDQGDKGLRKACDVTHDRMSERSAHWCKEMVSCSDKSDLSVLAKRIRDDFPQWSAAQKAGAKKCEERHKMDPDGLLPCFSSEGAEVEKALQKTVYSTSPLLADSDFQDNLRKNTNGKAPTEEQVMATLKSYLATKRTSLISDFRRYNDQMFCLKRNDAHVSEKSSLVLKSCDPEKLFYEAAEGGDPFPANFEQTSKLFARNNGDIPATRTQKTYDEASANYMIKARQCIQGRKSGKQKADFATDLIIDTGLMLASGGLGMAARSARLLTYAERISAFNKLRLAMSAGSTLLSAGGTAISGMRSFRGCANLDDAKKEVIVKLADPSAPMCMSGFKTLESDPSTMSCIESLAAAGLFSADLLKKARKLQGNFKLANELSVVNNGLEGKIVSKIFDGMDPKLAQRLENQIGKEGIAKLEREFAQDPARIKQELNRLKDCLSSVNRLPKWFAALFFETAHACDLSKVDQVAGTLAGKNPNPHVPKFQENVGKRVTVETPQKSTQYRIKEVRPDGSTVLEAPRDPTIVIKKDGSIVDIDGESLRMIDPNGKGVTIKNEAMDVLYSKSAPQAKPPTTTSQPAKVDTKPPAEKPPSSGSTNTATNAPIPKPTSIPLKFFDSATSNPAAKTVDDFFTKNLPADGSAVKVRARYKGESEVHNFTARKDGSGIYVERTGFDATRGKRDAVLDSYSVGQDARTQQRLLERLEFVEERSIPSRQIRGINRNTGEIQLLDGSMIPKDSVRVQVNGSTYRIGAPSVDGRMTYFSPEAPTRRYPLSGNYNLLYDVPIK